MELESREKKKQGEGGGLGDKLMGVVCAMEGYDRH